MAGRWIFGYGSLVNPVSFGTTVGRPFTVGRDFHYAVLDGWGRRWNYGVGHLVAHHAGSRVTVVALGVIRSVGESANGVVGWVADDELADLDQRERDYDRVDITGLVEAPVALDAPVETYVPRPVAVARYEAARDAGTAAVEQRYWDLVAGAFAGFGRDERQRFLATTPAPDVPIVELEPFADQDRNGP